MCRLCLHVVAGFARKSAVERDSSHLAFRFPASGKRQRVGKAGRSPQTSLVSRAVEPATDIVKATGKRWFTAFWTLLAVGQHLLQVYRFESGLADR